MKEFSELAFLARFTNPGAELGCTLEELAERFKVWSGVSDRFRDLEIEDSGEGPKTDEETLDRFRDLEV